MRFRICGSDPLFSAVSSQGDKNGDVPRNGIFILRAKDKNVPIAPGVAAVAYEEGAVTLRCPPFLGNQRIPMPIVLGSCCKVYHLTLIRLTEKVLQLLTVFLQYVDKS
jgi:hypothetical protein